MATVADARYTVPARYWHRVSDGRIQCDLCPRYCKLRPGQRGLCYVRAREDDHLVLTTWGRSSGFCVDPIEKKPLSHFLPGTAVLSFGTAGCNLACKFCQNWDITKARDDDRLAAPATADAIAKLAGRFGCRSVAYTYNDPVVFMEYAIDTAKRCRTRGIKNVAVTAGYICEEPRTEFFRYMDAVNVDLKAFSEWFYRRLCGGHVEPILDTLRYLRFETDVWLEITTLLIPEANDSTDEIDASTRWIAEELGQDVPLHFTAFHPAWKMNDRPPTPPETLRRARRIAMANGLRYVYTGNVHDPKGNTTICAGCGCDVIRRDGYRVLEWRLDDSGHCLACGEPCSGVFDGPPGDWGPRRMAVRPDA